MFRSVKESQADKHKSACSFLRKSMREDNVSGVHGKFRVKYSMGTYLEVEKSPGDYLLVVQPKTPAVILVTENQRKNFKLERKPKPQLSAGFLYLKKKGRKERNWK